MRPADNINDLIKKLKLKASGDLDKRVHDDISKALAESDKSKSAVTQPKIGRTIMKSPIVKLAVAAVIVIAVLISISQIGDSATGVAWGEVVRDVEKIHTIQYRETITGSEERMTIVSFSPEYGLKEECYKNGEISTIACYQKPEKMLVAVLPRAEAYERRPLTERGLRIVQTKRDGRYYIRTFMSVEHKQLGRANINGVEVEGIEIDSAEPFEPIPPVDSFVGRLWVDVVNNLPVLVELEFVPVGSTVQTKVVMDDIQWNVEFSKSDFEPNIPDDYEQITIN